MSETYRITMDTSASPSITVHLDNGNRLVFSKRGSGLYYYDTDSESDSNGKPSMLQTNHS